MRPAVGVDDAAWQRSPQRHRPFERGDGVPGIEAAADRVADDAARPSVENDRDIDEAGGDGDVSQVRHPELVGPVDLEVPRDERVDRPVVVAVGGTGETTSSPWVEVVLTHQPADLLGIDDMAAVAELGVDTAIAVALELVGDRPDLGDGLQVGRSAFRRGVIGGARQSHQCAPPFDGEAGGPVIADVVALFGAVAFFRAPF